MKEIPALTVRELKFPFVSLLQSGNFFRGIVTPPFDSTQGRLWKRGEGEIFGAITRELRSELSGRNASAAFQKLLLCMFFLLVALASCRSNPAVIFASGAGRDVKVEVEIADTPAKRARGLMYRNDLGENQGMLFLFPAPVDQTFWMKNTPLSLDLIYIGSDMRVVGIVERATPFSTESLSVSASSQFVLEVRGGFCQRNSIKAGSTVRFEGVALDSVTD